MSDEKIKVFVSLELGIDKIQHILQKQGVDAEVFELTAPEPIPEIPELPEILEDRPPPGIVKPVESWQRRGRRKNKLFK